MSYVLARLPWPVFVRDPVDIQSKENQEMRKYASTMRQTPNLCATSIFQSDLSMNQVGNHSACMQRLMKSWLLPMINAICIPCWM